MQGGGEAAVSKYEDDGAGQGTRVFCGKTHSSLGGRKAQLNRTQGRPESTTPVPVIDPWLQTSDTIRVSRAMNEKVWPGRARRKCAKIQNCMARAWATKSSYGNPVVMQASPMVCYRSERRSGR